MCHACRFHYTIGARERIESLVDPGSFRENNRALISIDPIAFARSYKRRLFDEERRTGLADAIVTGTARMDGRPVVLAVLDFRFLGGTIGSVVGEKLTRGMELAARRRHPFLAVIASGGARVQEGPLGLMQTAKIAMARQRLADARTPFVCVMGNPTVGAAYTGIGALADITVGEPGAIIGYTARNLRDNHDALTAERLLARGLLDEIVDRAQLRGLLVHVLEALTARTRVSAEREHPAQPRHEHGHAWNNVQIARHARRPTALDYVGRMASTYVELRGDGAGSDPPVITCGVALIAGESVVVVGQQRVDLNDGGPYTADAPTSAPGAWQGPAAFRKATRAFRLAGRFDLPVITLIDTPGADPGVTAAEGGLGPALAACTAALAETHAPTIAAVIGQGGSEAAAAFAIADRVLMLEHAIYTVMSPEQAALLLHRDPGRAEEVADALHLTADACRELKVVDVVVPEPEGGAHTDHDAAARHLRAALLGALADVQAIPAERRLRARYRRYRDIGEYSSYIGTTLTHEVSELGTAIANRTAAAAQRIRHPRRERRAPEEAEPLIP